MARGVDRRRMFVDDDDYQTYLRLLAQTIAYFGWRLLAFCLMPNHIHLLLETPRGNLGKGIQWLHSNYVTYFNRRHARMASLFGARYRAPRPIKAEAKFLQLLGYIAANPVDARLVRRAADWPWCSHSLVAAGEIPGWLDHERTLELIDAMTGIDAYEQLIATAERLAY